MRPWSTQLFAGDLLKAIPFGDQPTVVYTAEDGEASGKHFVGEVVFGYGLLVTPTCDMVDQHGGGELGHPYRIIAPVLPLSVVLGQTGDLEQSANLIRSRDAVAPYIYLPALPGVFEEEQVACLFRPGLVADDLLRDPPRRVAQLQPEARRHLKVKLAGYWARVRVAHEDLPLQERDEDQVRGAFWPPSLYDGDEPAV
ncbi:MAG: hypothetical protein QOJ29_3132 [Thermoleophilaceae bacterium]|nr:hypothetical protein [Thermoleophilaceae bacterium]